MTRTAKNRTAAQKVGDALKTARQQRVRRKSNGIRHISDFSEEEKEQLRLILKRPATYLVNDVDLNSIRIEETTEYISAILDAAIASGISIPVHHSGSSRLFHKYQQVYMSMLNDPSKTKEEREKIARYGAISGLVSDPLKQSKRK